MKLPRWMHELYADLFGYFWLPCPLCAEYFGGHECEPGNVIYTSPGRGLSVCPNCREAAKEYNLRKIMDIPENLPGGAGDTFTPL